jgi:hypothetical protein
MTRTLSGVVETEGLELTVLFSAVVFPPATEVPFTDGRTKENIEQNIAKRTAAITDLLYCVTVGRQHY